MGKKRASIRTLSDGYKVTHHPDGKTVLCPGQSRLRQRLMDAHSDCHCHRQDQLDCQREQLDRKRASHAANPAVPASKRCC